ncbi:hypothetical protein Ocin01_14901 [Orchesella cincta]|uniref:Uncharacterized protein n=1 Tax=Orchesella cincta TaxID=48709 RepID=A0A1D2MFL7_ORCCI|nr:hypothetical protein Ocin01_14901 [Orchesella cincta]
MAKLLASWKGLGKSESKEEARIARAIAKNNGRPHLLATNLNTNGNLFNQNRRHSSCILDGSDGASKLKPIVPLHSIGKENMATSWRKTSQFDLNKSTGPVQPFRHVQPNLRTEINHAETPKPKPSEELNITLGEARCTETNGNNGHSNGGPTSVAQKPIPFPRKPGILYRFGE